MTYEPKRAPDQPAKNDPQYRDSMKRYDTCPVCGKGDTEWKTWPEPHGEGRHLRVSHLACAEKLESKVNNLIKAARRQSEFSVGLTDEIRKLKAELAALKATLRLAATDYWREQMDGFDFDTDKPVDHIIEATIEKWRVRAAREETP